jgi:hypothetical protein
MGAGISHSPTVPGDGNHFRSLEFEADPEQINNRCKCGMYLAWTYIIEIAYLGWRIIYPPVGGRTDIIYCK